MKSFKLYSESKKSTSERLAGNLKTAGFDVNARHKYWSDKVRELETKRKEYEAGEKKQIDEISDKTLTSYLTKVDADSQKHDSDPTKRPAAKRNKSVMGFSRAFNKLDSRQQKEEVVLEDGMGAGAVAAGPTNTSSGGAVASVGQPPGSKFGEPGVYPGKKKKSDPRMFKQFRRKAPKM